VVKLNIIDSGPEKNELSRNAMGGTELMQKQLYNRVDKELLDRFQIIPSRVRQLKQDKTKILWCHDLPQDGNVSFLKDQHEVIDQLVFVSNYQKSNFIEEHDLPPSKCTVIQNAIVPIEEHVKPDDEINIVYFSTPHRGLGILVPVFESLYESHFHTLEKKIKLHVFSSFELYGWKERDEEFKQLFDDCKNSDNIEYYGSVSNDEMREHLKRMHIFAYPSIWPETSCLCLLEAMSARLHCVHSDLAALPETAANWTMMYGYHEDHNLHANIFAQQLYNAVMLCDDESMSNRSLLQKQYIDAFYSWDTRALQWKSYLESLIEGKGDG
jgi:glycosyltransferase involved in cell wall biosynthesis|tara:strand:- start:9095 stop:10072 length:978 start_codon:yes stop_codon:yes gene_type:complete